MTRIQWIQVSALAGFMALAGAGSLLCVPPAGAAVEKTEGGIRFTYSDPAAGAVTWAGEWNGWNATANPMVKGADGVWSITLPLPPGEHAYKYVVDNNWVADPDNPETKGEFGNSVITIGADGSPASGAAPVAEAGAGSARDAQPARGAGEIRANTAYSAKLEFHGRGIGLYESYLSRANDRFELRRPRLDFDLETAIRMSEVLTGRWLMKINAEEEALDFFRTRLTFDRGNLTFRKQDFELFAYDNEAAGTWDDPLHLVGDVGIYGHDYGYDRQGFRLRPRFGGFAGEIHYADNFRTGGTNYPAFEPADIEAAARTLPVADDGAGGFRFPAGAFASGATINLSDANEDMLAVRVSRDLGRATIGLLGRTDRGFDLGSGGFVLADGSDRIHAIGGTFEQIWYGYGAEARFRPGPAGLELFGEALAGRRVADFLSGAQTIVFQATFDDTGAVRDVDQVSSEDASNGSVVLDRSRRLALGARWRGDLLGGGSAWTATVAYQDHDDRARFDGLEAADRGRRSTWSARGRWDQAWGGVLPRAVATIVDVEWQGFDYRSDDPWDAQFWFSTRNFWLEHLGDKVSPDRIVMLGGRDVWTFRPELRVPLLPARNCAFEYAGRIHSHALTTRPKFIESFFRLGYDLTPSLRAQADTRWVKYDDPTLGLHSGYVDHFAELAYTFARGVQVALSYGVDPWVLDRATNAYAYRGRDDALAAGGVGSAGARTAFLDQGPLIAAAERAMRDQRRIAVEAIVRF
jgi:hypothetical protein